MNKAFPVLGFDIGGTKIAICLAMSDGTVIATGRVDNKMKTPDEVLPQAVAEGERILASAGISKQELRAIGISSPSPMDFDKGLISLQPQRLDRRPHPRLSRQSIRNRSVL